MNLHDFILLHRTRILETLASTLAQAFGDKRDDGRQLALAVTLDDVVAALAQRSESHRDAAREYGRSEQARGVPADKVVRQYGSVCSAIMQVAIEEGQSFSASDVQMMNVSLDIAIADAIGNYVQGARADDDRVADDRLAVVAHEVRNALASAQYSLAAIDKGHLGVGGATWALLRRSLARISTLVEHRLLTAKQRAGVPLERHRVSASRVMEDVAAASVPRRGVTVQVEPVGSLDVDGDATLLASALGNLVQNAIKFSREGGHVVMRAAAAEGFVTMEVEDECGGLPPGKVEDLFQPYAQSGRDRSGAGLGLTIAHDIAVAHGGQLCVRDRPGQGCVFALKIPEAVSVVTSPSPGAASRAPGE